MSILTGSHPLVRPGLSSPSWRSEVRAAVRDPWELCRLLDLPPSLAEEASEAGDEFPLFVPPHFLGLIRRGDPDDPLLRQVLPRKAETIGAAGFKPDPVGDSRATLQPGVLQKYAGRALLVTTGACAIHCRYCFRRHFPYEEIPHGMDAWDRALEALADDASIREVILSGGDPLMVTDDRLSGLVHRIAALPQVTRLRVHTRLPLMIPSRITRELLSWLTSTRLKPVVVIHANHAAELDSVVAHALARLTRAGVLLLNQAVLLRGVNDSVEVLARLSERLVEVGVVPYYLHQLDRVAGAVHYEVPVDEGRVIVKELRNLLPGYMVPTYVQEIPGERCKVVL